MRNEWIGQNERAIKNSEEQLQDREVEWEA